MHNQEEILQQKLLDLENGTPLKDILADLPAEEQELSDLIQMVALVRTTEHPKPSIAHQHSLKHTLIQNSANLFGNNGNGHRGDQDQQSLSNPTETPGSFRRFLPQRNLRLTIAALVGAFLVIAFIGSALLLGGLWLSNSPSGAQAASLANVSGSVEMASSATGTDWQPLGTNDILQSGQRVRTGPNSSATLVFFDGSRAQLGPDADITLNRVDGDRGNILRVVITQNAGKSTHQVVPFKGKNSTYLVFTPSGTVSVHGTQFSVDVGNSGRTRFAVDTGKVLVANQASQVYLTAGQTLSALPSETLDNPDYQFNLQGILTANTGNTWTIAGVDFDVNTDTQLNNDPQLNDLVLVEGHVLEEGAWLADSITKLENGDEIHSFNGELVDMEGEEWQVDGHTFLVDADTVVDEGLVLGNVVKVNFTVLSDGQWLALSVSLDEDDDEPTPTPDPEAEPILVFDPSEISVPACTGDASFNASLINNGPEEGDDAVDVVLDYAILSGGEYVDSISVDPAMIGLLLAGESENLEVEVEMDDTWESASEGTTLSLRVFIASEANTPGGHPADLNLTVVKDCADVETPTATLTSALTATETATAMPTLTTTLTLTATPTLTVSLTMTPEPTQETNCTGTNPHPKGTQLAQEYGVSYEEIMGWFCQNYGFGEIDQAYGLSLQYGVPVTDIFAMRESGLGWGQIKKSLANEQAEPTELPSETPEPPDATETPEPTEEDKDNGNNNNTCSPGAPQHPQGVNLAQQFGVTYDEIIGWYCQGFSFGDIRQAYGLSQDYNTPVADIFDMKASGMNWGQIRKDLGGKGKP